MIPGWWPMLILALGVCRLVRLAGWDEFPPIVRARLWLTGEKVYYAPTVGGVDQPLYRYVGRPKWIHDLITCPFCLGFWVSLVVYLAWWQEPKWATVAMVPFALSELVGLVSKNLDA